MDGRTEDGQTEDGRRRRDGRTGRTEDDDGDDGTDGQRADDTTTPRHKETYTYTCI